MYWPPSSLRSTRCARLWEIGDGCWCGSRGTEPLIRVMVEAATEAEATGAADALASEVTQRVG